MAPTISTRREAPLTNLIEKSVDAVSVRVPRCDQAQVLRAHVLSEVVQCGDVDACRDERRRHLPRSFDSALVQPVLQASLEVATLQWI